MPGRSTFHSAKPTRTASACSWPSRLLRTALPGFAGVNPRWEWNPGLLYVRGRLEDAFLSAVRNDVGEIGPCETAADAMDTLSVEPGRRLGPVVLLAEHRYVGDAGVLRAPLAVSPQGSRSARLRDPEIDRAGKGVVCCGRVR